jgi:SAM-dependent methyltransferase
VSDVISLDLAFYREHHSDLASMDDTQLEQHFFTHGVHEGRLCAAMAMRESLIEKAICERSILEIGPFCNPTVVGTNVRYFDVLDSGQLIERAKAIGYEIRKVPSIDFVSPTGDLSVISQKFDAAISAHCIEHQPDLIRHLQQVADLLTEGGKYYLIIPDKRYCFDHFLPEKSVADIIDAHRANRRTHALSSVIEHRALTAHNDCARHWRNDHGEAPRGRAMAGRVRSAIAEYERAQGSYIDVHAWQFTPEGFGRSAQTLYELGCSQLRVAYVHSTPRDRNEFTAILTKIAREPTG